MAKSKKNGKVIYHIKYWVNGKQKQEKVGVSYSDAVAADGKRASQKAEGKILDIAFDGKVTFNGLRDWFLKQPKIKKLKYEKILTLNLDKFLSEFGSYTVRSLSKLDLENYQTKLRDDGLSDSYIDQIIGAGRNMINTAWSGDKVPGDALRPFKQIKKLLKKNANARDVVLSFDDFTRLIKALPLHARNVVIAAFYTGMRRKEIMDLTWDRVDMGNRLISLRDEDTKTGKKRTVPIANHLYAVLDKIPRPIHTPYVFLFKGFKMKSIRASLRKACEDCGILYGRNTEGGMTFHDLRHTFATLMRKAGNHDRVTAGIDGHETMDMIKRYDTIDIDDMKSAIERFEQSLVGQNVDHKKRV